ncbi:unnamed protein product, partial [Sphacelaria rigidula]
MKEFEAVYNGRLPRTLELMTQRGNLKSFSETWRKKWKAINDKTARLKLVGSGGEGNVDDASVGEADGEGEEGRDRPAAGSREGKVCESCKPTLHVRYRCTHCGVAHYTFCDLLAPISEDATLTERKKHLCIWCEGDPERRKRKESQAPAGDGVTSNSGKKARKASVPRPPAGATMEEQRRKNFTTHAVNLLRRGRELIDGGDPLSVARQPKLILVSLDAEKSILSLTDDHVKRFFKRFVGKLLSALHPLGTIAFALPRPWFPHENRIRDAITQDHTMALKEDPVLIEYPSKHG